MQWHKKATTYLSHLKFKYSNLDTQRCVLCMTLFVLICQQLSSFDSSGILKVFSVKVSPSYKQNYMLKNYLDT